MICVDHLCYHYKGGRPILRDVSFELEDGRFLAVLGNNDFDEYGSEVGHFAHPVLGGVRFLVGHKPGDVRISFAGSAALAPGDPLPDVIVHGQSAHVPRAQLGERALGLMGHKAVHGGDMVVGNAHETRKLKPVLAKDGAHGQGVLLEDGRILHTWIENLDGKVLLEA
jgi:hypothetical protein